MEFETEAGDTDESLPFEIKTEADSSDITECSCDDMPSTGILYFSCNLSLHIHSFLCCDSVSVLL